MYYENGKFNFSKIMSDAWSESKRIGHCKRRFKNQLAIIWMLAREEKAIATLSEAEIESKAASFEVEMLKRKETLLPSDYSKISELQREAA